MRVVAPFLLARVPCHFPGCKKMSAPMSNYCKKHGKVMLKRYEKS